MMYEQMLFILRHIFRMPLKRQYVIVDAHGIITAKLTRSKTNRTFRNTHYLIMVIIKQTHRSIREETFHLLIINLGLANTHSPSARETFYLTA